MPALLSKLAFLGALQVAAGQQAGTSQSEGAPAISLKECTKSGGCSTSQHTAVLDSNWRWVHKVGDYKNCYTGSSWDTSLCPDPQTCAQNCALEGVSSDQYANTYGITPADNGLKLKFVTVAQYGTNYGSRVYMMDGADSYKIFKLKNREFSFDVDVSQLPCGLNGAVYFAEMDKYGNKGGGNQAGARFGTGYCDAQCPHDIKWINGEANVMNWDAAANPPVGHYGTCCAEMDIWEANRMASAYTVHPCQVTGQKRCEGIECGDSDGGHRYDGVCDKDGCDFNSFRMGEKAFFGMGSGFAVDTTMPITLVTQFITSDGTDSGDLVEVRRFYRQNGKIIPNSQASILGPQGADSVKDDYCSVAKSSFGDRNDYQAKGGMKAMGEAMDRGMVLVMSLWDDSTANMLWLDASYPTDKDPSVPGVARGACPLGETNTPEYVRRTFPDASVRYTNFAVGEIGSTMTEEVVV